MGLVDEYDGEREAAEDCTGFESVGSGANPLHRPKTRPNYLFSTFSETILKPIPGPSLMNARSVSSTGLQHTCGILHHAADAVRPHAARKWYRSQGGGFHCGAWVLWVLRGAKAAHRLHHIAHIPELHHPISSTCAALHWII